MKVRQCNPLLLRMIDICLILLFYVVIFIAGRNNDLTLTLCQ